MLVLFLFFFIASTSILKCYANLMVCHFQCSSRIFGVAADLAVSEHSKIYVYANLLSLSLSLLRCGSLRLLCSA